MCDSAFSQRRHQKAGAGSIRRRINIARCQPANLHHSSPLRCKGPGGTTKFPQRWKLNQICWSSKLMWEPGLWRGVRYTGPYLCCNSKELAIVNQIRSRFPWLQGQEKTSPPPSWSKDHPWAASHYVDTGGCMMRSWTLGWGKSVMATLCSRGGGWWLIYYSNSPRLRHVHTL